MVFRSRRRVADSRRMDSTVRFETLEERNLLAADFGVVEPFSSSLLTHVPNDVAIDQRLEVLRSHLNADSNDSFQLISQKQDLLGFEHFKYQHLRNGLAVEGSHYTVHAKDGLIVSLSGEHHTITTDVSQPTISESAALQNALDYIGADYYVWQDVGFQDSLIAGGAIDHGDHVHLQGEGHEPGCTCANCVGLGQMDGNVDDAANVAVYAFGQDQDSTNSDTDPGCSCSSCMGMNYNHVHSHSHGHHHHHNHGSNISFEMPEGELVYAQGRLTYKFDIYATAPMSRDFVYVDAGSGEIVDSITRIHHIDLPGNGPSLYDGNVDFTADFTGTEYRMRNVDPGVQTFDMNSGTNYGAATDFTSSTPLFNDTRDDIGVQTQWGTEQTWDYFFTNHNRDSFDDNGTVLRSYVSYRNSYTNAFWNGSFMTYGDGNGTSRGPLVSLDIVGHEVAHGVTQFTAGLIYRDQSGALNESFSDIFGEAVENHARGSNDWLMGGDIGLNGHSGQFRSMADPNLFNHADTYLGDYWRIDNSDVGGVHRNSGVQNKWFYIMVNGEAGTNDTGHTYNVTGVGMQDAAAIAYRNLSVYLTNNSTYPDARVGAVQAAIDLFGIGSQQHLSTMEAWDAVGVYDLQDTLAPKPLAPLGSLVYADSIVNDVQYQTHVKEFSLELDANQTISLQIANVTGDLIPAVTVLAPGGAVLGSAFAATSSDTIVFQSLPATNAGEYLIQVTGAPDVDGDPTMGSFSLDLQLNADFEWEEIGFGSNDALISAQAIDNTSIGLGATAFTEFDRLAVTGILGDETSGIPLDNEDFESGTLGSNWETYSSTSNGRIEIAGDTGTPYGLNALAMDVSVNGLFTLNEAIWTVDLTDATDATLNFSETSFGDEIHLLPSAFLDHYNGDGVAVSEDGQTWYTISTGTLPNGFWQDVEVDLIQVADDFDLTLGSDFKIKFQQYDNFSRSSDGRAYDNISIGGAPAFDWFSFDLDPQVPVTVGVTDIKGNPADILLELYDANETLLATGIPSDNVDQYIENFSHAGSATETIYVKLTGASEFFNLVVTRNGLFNFETATIPSLNGYNGTLGYVSANIEVNAEPDFGIAGEDVSSLFNGVTLSNPVNNGFGNAIYAVPTVTFDAPTGNHVFSYRADDPVGFREGVNELRADFVNLQSFVSIDVGSDDTGDIAFLRAYDINDVLLEEVVSGIVPHSLSETLSISRSTADISYIVAAGVDSHTSPLDNLVFEEDASDVDVYNVEAVVGQSLGFTLHIPGEGPFEFPNRLSGANGRTALIQLMDPNGQLVDSSDESIAHVAQQSGTYQLIVAAFSGDGEYYVDRHVAFDPINLDFGTDKTLVERGWTKFVTDEYDPAVGYGWLGRTRGLQAFKFGGPSDLTNDGFEVSQGTFVVDVPNGNYRVSLLHGETKHLDDVMMTYEGVPSTYTPQYQQSLTQGVSVTDGQLTIDFQGLPDADPFVRVAALAISRLPPTNNFDGGGTDSGERTVFPGSDLPGQDEAFAFDQNQRREVSDAFDKNGNQRSLFDSEFSAEGLLANNDDAAQLVALQSNTKLRDRIKMAFADSDSSFMKEQMIRADVESKGLLIAEVLDEVFEI